MRARSQRLWLIATAGVLLAGATALALTALQDSVAYFYAPSELVAKDAHKEGTRVRVGGLVEAGSIERREGAEVRFKITDGANAVPVTFSQLLPDLFEEGQGVVAEGRLDPSGLLVAERVLARHDENYMPKEVYDALRKAAPANGESPAGYGAASGAGG
ncbi:cytochrome c maturation protein CcmE [bacterium]|nr:cytochrome c maturation protein CcmE [bacterium]